MWWWCIFFGLGGVVLSAIFLISHLVPSEFTLTGLEQRDFITIFILSWGVAGVGKILWNLEVKPTLTKGQ